MLWNLQVLEQIKVQKEMDRATLVDVSRTSLRTKVHSDLADLLTEVNVIPCTCSPTFSFLFIDTYPSSNYVRSCTTFITVTVRRTCLMRCSRSRLRRHEKDYDRLAPRTTSLRDWGPSLANVRFRTLALPLGIACQKPSVKHRHKHISRNF